MKIPGVYVEIKGDMTHLTNELKKSKALVAEQAKGMSNALNNSLSDSQIKTSVNNLVNNLGALSRTSQLTGGAFKNIGVDLGQLRAITGTTDVQFAKLQSRLLETQAAKQQENALKGIARAAGLAEDEVRGLGKQFGMSEGQINRVVASSDRASRSIKEVGRSTDFSMTKLKDMIITVGIYTGAFAALSATMYGIANEFKRGLSSIEEFNVGVASSAAFITTFSKRAQAGDLAGGFKEANEYAGLLAQKLEMVDSKTIASGKDLQVMSETMLQHGVLLDINNEKQVTGFTNIATALALVTAGQNKDIQMRQEINSLLMGQVRATDRLPKLLSAIDPHLQDHLKIWKEEGTLIENVGKLLQGFAADTGELDRLWATVGSTMDTIHKRVLRGAFKPIFEDLIGLAMDLNSSLMDANGQLTPLAKTIQNDVSGAYETAKNMIKQYGGEVSTAAGFLVSAKFAQLAFNFAIKSSPYVMAAGGLMLLNEQLKKFDDNIGSIPGKFKAMKESMRNIADVLTGDKDASTGASISKESKIKDEITLLQKQLAGSKSMLPGDPEEDKRNVDEIKGKIDSLYERLREMRKAGGLTVSTFPTPAPEMVANKSDDGGNKPSSPGGDVNPLDPYAKLDSSIQSYFSSLDILTQKEAERTAGLMESMKATNMHIQGLNGIQNASTVAEDSWSRLITLSKEYDETVAKVDTALIEFFDGVSEPAETFSDDMKNAVTGWASGFSASLTDMVFDADASFGSIAESFARMLMQMVIQKGIIEPLLGFAFPAMKASAQGNVFSGSGISAYSNQIVSSPTVFPFAKGAGLMGEAGSEAIMPLTRMPGGNLGVNATGGAVNNIIINNYSDQTATQTEQSNDTGGMDIEVMIGSLVARETLRHGSPVNRAVRSATGSGTQMIRR